MGKWKIVGELSDRFWKHIDKRGEDECWNWCGATNNRGFGVFWIDTLKAVQAHRYMLEVMGTPVDSSIDILRLCGNNLCCNPKHFEIQTLDVRFWKFVSKTDNSGCWMWTGSVNRASGYGFFTIMGKRYGAHRVSYELHNGFIPDGIKVCHKCNNRRCVNPDHLYLGTVQDNSDYMVECNRQARGENNGNSVLTRDDVIKIKRLLRDSSFLHREIAEIFGCKRPTITDIAKGRTWSWVKID